MENLNFKVEKIKNLAKQSPVLVVGMPCEAFGNSTIISGKISSYDLGITRTSKGLKTPKWLYGILVGNSSHQIVIDGVDQESKENQEKFYELLKYKAISDFNLPNDCTIIVIADNLKNVSETIIRLCLVV